MRHTCGSRRDRSRKNSLFNAAFLSSPPNLLSKVNKFCRIVFVSIRSDPVKMADRTAADMKPKCTPAELMLKVILTGTLSHYETRGMIDDKRLEHMLSAGKQILYKTHQESDVR